MENFTKDFDKYEEDQVLTYVTFVVKFYRSRNHKICYNLVTGNKSIRDKIIKLLESFNLNPKMLKTKENTIQVKVS